MFLADADDSKYVCKEPLQAVQAFCSAAPEDYEYPAGKKANDTLCKKCQNGAYPLSLADHSVCMSKDRLNSLSTGVNIDTTTAGHQNCKMYKADGTCV